MMQPSRLPTTAQLATHRYRVLAAYVAGVMTAAFLLVGRWQPGRPAILGYVDARQMSFLQPRVIVVVLLGLAVFSLPLPTWVRPSHLRRPGRMALALGGFLLLSVIWALNSEFAAVKASELILMMSVGLLFGLAVTGDYGHLTKRAFWFALVAASGVLAALGAFQVVTNVGASFNRYAIVPLGGGPNIYGRNMALLTVVLVAWALSGRTSGKIAYPAAGLTGLLVLVTGSRGALLALAAGLVVALLATRPQVKRLAAIVAMIGLTVAFVGEYSNIIDQASLIVEQRLAIGDVADQFSSSREEPFRESLECYSEHPLNGVGLGGFAELSRFFGYPHNLFLEVGCEGGTIALTLLVVVLVVGGVAVFRERSHIDPAALAAFVVLLVSAQFSGDLFDSRGLIVLGVLVIAGRAARVGGQRRRVPRWVNSAGTR